MKTHGLSRQSKPGLFQLFSSGTGYLRSVFSVQSSFLYQNFFFFFHSFVFMLSSTTNQLQYALIMLSAVLLFLPGILNAHYGAHLKGTLRAQSDSDPVSLFCLIEGRLALESSLLLLFELLYRSVNIFQRLPRRFGTISNVSTIILKIPGAI